MSDPPVSWLGSLLRKLVAGPLSNLVLGTTDERSADRIALDAMRRTAAAVVDSADDKAVEFAARVLDEQFKPAELVNLRQAEGSASLLSNFTGVIRRQLAPLYAPALGGPSAAQRLGMSASLDELTNEIVANVAYLAAFQPASAGVLHALRAEWLAAGGPVPKQQSAFVEVRYLVCSAFDLLTEIAFGRLEHLPVDNPRLFENDVARFWRRLAVAHRSNGGVDRLSSVPGGSWSSANAYMQAFADARRPEVTDLPSYELVRPCTAEDAEELARRDVVSRLLLDSGVAPADLAVAAAYFEECGSDEGFHESFILRPVLGLFLELRVDAATPVVATRLRGRSESSLRPIEPDAAPELSWDLPQLRLRPGESMIVPLATLVPRLPVRAPHRHELEWGPLPQLTGAPFDEADWSELSRYRSQSLALETLSTPLDAWGPHLVPDSLDIVTGGAAATVGVRPFNPGLVYTIDRSWMMGSCPHAFLSDGEQVTYAGALFSSGPSISQDWRLETPPGVAVVEIAELEPEVTVLASVIVDGLCRARWVVLRRTMSLSIPVDPTGSLVEVRGFYVASPGARDGLRFERDRLVAAHLASGSGRPPMVV